MVGLYRFTEKELSVGRGDNCHIIVSENREVAAIHLLIRRQQINAELVVEGRSGAYVNEVFCQCNEIRELNYADEIRLFELRIQWLGDIVAVSCEGEKIAVNLEESVKQTEELYHAGANVMEDDSSGDDSFYRPPRVYYSLINEKIELDAPPARHEDENQPLLMTILPALTMSLPMIMGFLVSKAAAKGSGAVSSTFMYAGLVTAICSAFIGIIIAVMNLKSRTAKQAINEARRKRAYLDYVSESENRIKDFYNKNILNLRLTYPEISDYFRANNRSKNYDEYLLWNRTKEDDDYLAFRIGTGARPFNLDISIPKTRFSIDEDELRDMPARLKEKYAKLKEVPITVDLSANNCIGVLCDDDKNANEMFLMLALELAVSVSPSELSMHMGFNGKIISRKYIAALKFIPHSQWDEVSEDTRIRVVFTDDSSCAKLDLGENTKLVFFAKDFGSLPTYCNLIIQRNSNFNGIIHLFRDRTERTTVHFDRISILDAKKYSRVLQGIRTRSLVGSYQLKDKVSFFELYGEEITKETVLKNWKHNFTGESIYAPIGKGEDGTVLRLDLHENGMGPHGLIAGMTGSGKSEILQTIILSLCVLYSPEEVGFFLIDYKGGGMSELFSDIPHLLGSISNLSGRMVYRAMMSVKSENERRQRLFINAKVNNIAEYQKKYRNNNVIEPLPHIFIIIDEFAELKREEPEFMKELVSVARVGRSLGVHLILATQKPSGTVDDDILSNSRFRICLRVQDRMDSMEMLKGPQAASITNPGRAYLKIGNDELFTQFQGAYTMDRSTGVNDEEVLKLFDEDGNPVNKRAIINEKQVSAPQLLRCLSAITYASDNCEYKRCRKLWLEPLKESIIYPKEAERCDVKKEKRSDLYDIEIGIMDNPAGQEQKQLILNFIKSGHHIILGTLQSGKSTLLTTISFALMKNATPEMLSMYFIDYSHGMIRPFRKSWMTGVYIAEENEEDIEKLFVYIESEIENRKEILKGGNYRQYIEAGNKMPAMIIVIDGLGAFRESTKCDFDKGIENILKNGEALGIYILVTALSVSSQEIPRRLFELFGVCLPLKLKDRYEYKDVFSIIEETVMMPENVRGRGLAMVSGKAYEFQTYRIFDTENDFEIKNYLENEVEQRNVEIKKMFSPSELSRMKKQVPVVPKPFTDASFFNAVFERLETEGFDLNRYIPAGFFKNSGCIYGIPLVDNLKIIISGRTGTGKKTLVKIIGQSISKFDAYRENGIAVEERWMEPDNCRLKLTNGEEIIVCGERMASIELMRIKELAGSDPYVIHFGGALDRQNLADFSYIPYSMQIKPAGVGQGIVRKTTSLGAHGEIVIPRVINDDLC